MASFKDTTGDTWVVTLNLGVIDEILERTGEDIADAGDEGMAAINRVMANPRKFALTLFILVADQLVKRGVNEQQFKERLDGDSMREATIAMMEAWVNFTQRSQVTGTAFSNRLRTEAEKMERKIAEAIASMPASGVGGLPDTLG